MLTKLPQRADDPRFDITARAGYAALHSQYRGRTIVNTALLAAAGLTVALGLAHSALGEVLIFRHWRRDPAALRQAGLPPRHMRILWASWHLATLFGLAFAAILYAAAMSGTGPAGVLPVTQAIAVATCAGGGLVLAATRGRHPGWIVLLMIAGLTWWS